MTASESDFCMAYIGLGSNLSTPAAQIASARLAIRQLEGVTERVFSSLYQSSPMGPQDQPDYINAVMAIRTDIPAKKLLRDLQEIENQHRRERNEQRWGARTLDLDILLYGDQQIDQPDLIVPHYGIAKRAFVLYPLQEIAPELTIPGLGPVIDLVAKCPPDGLKRIEL